ncbi:hypothetical protein PACTADRAFT_50367 [Pachysolen tannophilus NRRL Y-2460]|uniref:Uncharacterized protein n=1 Tax=Pachysolen tannophilus NRRL Y-2460 TaxID=669874 RepID=A0A1E4TVJ7_PACTA|nr:hypothetical protein PACTADRAFT_50367 [Pachysolen tannophilus NRRL Y-2460]
MLKSNVCRFMQKQAIATRSPVILSRRNFNIVSSKPKVKEPKEKPEDTHSASFKPQEEKIPETEIAHDREIVSENVKGYKDLQDKGSKVELEQERPEDEM